MGGLGNQLFQIFTTISYALKYKKEFAFLYTEYLGTGNTIQRKTYWNTFFKSLKKGCWLSLVLNKFSNILLILLLTICILLSAIIINLEY